MHIQSGTQVRQQSGFAHFALFLLAIVVLAGIVAAGWFVFQKDNKGDANSGATDTGWQEDCEGDQRVTMKHTPMDMENVDTVTPLGMVAGGHVTPIDHLYFFPVDSSRDKFPVYAMADGDIIEISVRGVNVDTGDQRPPEYRIIMQHSCQTVSYFDLVTKLDQSIIDAYPEAATKGMKGRFPIKAGQEIGRIGAQTLDTAIYNLDLTLSGFTSPEMYRAEPWKVHTDDFFSYFNTEMQDEMLAKNARVAEPRSGKIDYDQPGKLIGNWFEQGTDGYAGRGTGQAGQDGKGYWSTHLAVFPFSLDPSLIVVSIGDFNGQPQAFGVRGNTPDPAAVDVSSGVIKYELVAMHQGVTKSVFNPETAPSKGTVLFQVLAGEKLKVEVFPGRAPSNVSGFTSKALTYER